MAEGGEVGAISCRLQAPGQSAFQHGRVVRIGGSQRVERKGTAETRRAQPGGAGNPKSEDRRGRPGVILAGGDSFRAAHLTAETRRAQPGGAVNPKFEARNSKQIRIDGNGPIGKRKDAKFLRKLRAISTIAVQRRKPSAASFLCTAIVCIVRRLQRNFASSCSSTSTFGLLITSEVPASKMRK